MTHLNLLQAVDVDETSPATPDALLTQALPHLLDALDAASAVRVFWLSEGGLVRGTEQPAADDSLHTPGTFVAWDNLPAHYDAYTTAQTVQADEQLIMPLSAAGAVIALLEIDSTDSDTQQPVLQEIKRQLALLLENRLLQQVVQRQIETAAELLDCKTFEDVVSAFARHMVNREQFVSVTPFEFDSDGHLTAARVLSSANRHDVYSGNQPVNIDTQRIKVIYNLLNTEGALLIHDIETGNQFDEQARQWLRENDVKSMYLLPLHIEGRLQGILSLIDTEKPLILTPLERRAYQTLARQAASVIEGRQMLSSAEASLEEQRSLYNLSESLMQADTIPDILKALHRHMGTDAPRINYSENVYDDNGDFKEFNVRYIMNDEGLHEVDMPMHDMLDDHQFEEVKRYWENIGDTLEIVEDYDNLPDEAAFLAELRSEGIGSSISLPIVEQGRRERQINLTWEHPRAFDAQVRRVLETARTQITLVLRNRQLLQVTRESARESGLQAQVLRQLNSLMSRSDVQRNESSLLDETARLLMEATGMDHVGIALMNRDKNTATVVSEYPDTNSTGQTVEAGEGSIADYLRQEREVLRVPNVQQNEELQPKSLAALQNVGAKSAFFVPMFDLDGTLLGSIGLDSYTRRTRFDDDIIDVAETIASQLAINLQKLRLLQGSQRQAARMQQITAFSQSVQATLQVSDILGTALDYSETVLPSHYLAIMTYERTTQTLRIAARLHGDEREVKLPGLPVDMDENTVAQAAWEKRELVRVDDLQSNWEWKHPDSQHLRTVLATPLMARGILLGIIEVGSEDPDAYDDTDTAAFQQMSNQVAVALSNANAYARSQKVATNKALANEIVAELQQQTEVESILQVTARELGKALGAKRARIRLSAETDITGKRS